MKMDSFYNYRKLNTYRLRFIKTNSFLFIFWPFLAFLNSLRNFRLVSAKYFIVLFLGLYGYTFIFVKGHDSIHYVQEFFRFSDLTFGEFLLENNSYNSEDSSSLDFVIPFISYILSKITNNYHILFAIFALLYGTIYILSINIFYKIYSKSKNTNILFLLSFFILILPIFEINGIRFWFATWIFFYGSYFVVKNKDYRYLILTLSSCFVHFAFTSPNILLIIFLLTGATVELYYPVLVLSFLIPDIVFNYLDTILSFFSLSISKKASLYTNLNNIESLNFELNKTRFFLRYISDLIYWYCIGSVFVFFLSRKHFIMDVYEKRIYSFLILLLSFVNFLSVIASGSRFRVLFYLFTFAFLIMVNAKIRSKKFEFINYFGVLIFVIDLVYTFRLSAEDLNLIIFLPFALLASYYNLESPAFNIFFRWLH